MTLSYTYNGGAITHDIAPSTASIESVAEQGASAFSSFQADDPDADLELLGHRPAIIEESACAAQPRLFTGWTTERGVGRVVEAGLHGDETTRGVDVTLVDVDALFNFRLLSGTDAKRPAETWQERLNWLLGSDYLTGLIADTGHIIVNTVAMDAADYTDGFPAAVMSDLMDRTGYNYFAFWDPSTSSVGLFVGHDGDSFSASSLSISNVIADIDSDYCFAPDPAAQLTVVPTETYSEVIVNYAHGTKRLFRSRASTAARFVRRGTTIERPYTGGQATASRQAEVWLDKHSVETDRITCTIIVPATRVGLLVAGQSIDVKFSHLTNYTTATTMHCARLTVTPVDDLARFYSMTMELILPVVTVNDCDLFQKYYDSRPDWSSLGTEHWADGNEHSWMGIPGSWSQNNEAFVHFAEPVSPYAAHPVTFQSIHVYWHYGGAYDINGAPSAPSGAAAAFAFDISTGDEDGPWTEILAEADPVTLAGVTYPDDFDLVFVLPSPVTADWIQFRSTSAGNNDIYEIYLCEAADTEVELPPPPNAPITSTADPTADDGAPLPVGQTWINTTTGEVFVLVDNTAGAAVWVSTSGGVVDHGALTGLADDDHTQYVRKTLGGKEVVSTVAASGATETLDLASGNVHDVTLTADCTLTFTGATNGVACSFTLLLRQDGTGGWTTTWPGSVVWAGGTAPTLDETASTTAVLTFFTLDGGTVWYGFPTGGGGEPATTVTDETTWGIAPAVGNDTEYARQDHTHGSPAEPAAGIGELLVADVPAVVPVGTFATTANQTVGSTTTAYAVAFAAEIDKDGLTHDNVTNNSRIYIEQTGEYSIFVSAIADDTAADKTHMDCWLAINGTPVADSNTHVEIATKETEVVIAVAWNLDLAAGQYIEIMYHGDATTIQFHQTAAGASPTRPASPAVICTVDMIAPLFGVLTNGPTPLLLDDGSDFIYADV